MQSRNARIGMQLFCVYLLLYGGFVLINTFSAETMEMMPIDGINLAIIYGFGLIAAALVLALIYGAVCDGEPDASASSPNAGSADQQDTAGEDA